MYICGHPGDDPYGVCPACAIKRKEQTPKPERVPNMLPIALPPEEVVARLQEARAGNTVKATELILGHMRLATSIATRIALQYGRIGEIDDVQSEAYIALCKAIHTLIKGHDEAPVAYIMLRVRGAVRDYLAKTRVVSISRRTMARNGVDQLVQVELPETSDKKESDEFNLFVTREQIQVAISGLDERVFNLREQGYNDVEISKMLGCSEQKINLIRQTGRSRYYAIEHSTEDDR